MPPGRARLLRVGVVDGVLVAEVLRAVLRQDLWEDEVSLVAVDVVVGVAVDEEARQGGVGVNVQDGVLTRKGNDMPPLTTGDWSGRSVTGLEDQSHAQNFVDLFSCPKQNKILSLYIRDFMKLNLDNLYLAFLKKSKVYCFHSPAPDLGPSPFLPPPSLSSPRDP